MHAAPSLPLDNDQHQEETPSLGSRRHPAIRVAKYAGKRFVAVLLTIFIGTFIMVVAANGRGVIDGTERDRAYREMLQARPDYYIMEPAEQDELRAHWESQEGVTLPFLARHLRWTYKALTLTLGPASPKGAIVFFAAPGGLSQSSVALLEALPNTLLLISVSFLLLFVIGIPFALHLSQRPGGGLDRLMGLLTPLSSIPAWVTGFLLIIIFAVGLRIFPAGRMTDTVPAESTWDYVFMVIRHMALPVIAILMSLAFTLIFTWRTFFLTYGDEDYVDVGRAKGLPDRRFKENYILRPVLPSIITSFALAMVGIWQMVTTVEFIFDWPGIGHLFVKSLPNYLSEGFYAGDPAILVGTIVIFAYMFGLTVFLLDFIYVLVDPRLRIGVDDRNMRPGRIQAAPRAPRGSWRESFRAGRPRFRLPQDPRAALRRARSGALADLGAGWAGFRSFAREVGRYPSAVIGFSLVAILVAISIYMLVALPYLQIGRDWMLNIDPRSPLPKMALPAWVNLFRKSDLPQTVALDSRTGDVEKLLGPESDGVHTVTLTYNFDYPYTEFPQDLAIFYYPKYQEKVPFTSVTITTPDGRTFDLPGVRTTKVTDYEPGSGIRLAKVVAANSHWKKWFVTQGQYPTPSFYALFADPQADSPRALPGTYQVQVHGVVFEKDSDIDAHLVVFGQVHGWAGTDYLRRDLAVPLLWGMPVALIFGLLGALAITIGSAVVGAAAAWYSGWVDSLLQTVSGAIIILPVLAIAILFYAYFQVSIWLILTMVILLSIFGTPAKTFRAAFLQAKEAPYVEAAKAYGASNWRILWHYLIPRVRPVMLPQLIALIPSFVFLEATFAIFNVSETTYPTWGLVIQTALKYGASYGSHFWVLQPIALLLLTGVAFGMSSAAIDKILNPRLRTH
jgi:peptide/nickel transport system permease protein